MKKIILSMIIALAAMFIFTACKPGGDSSSSESKPKVVEYYIGIVDTLHPSPYNYFVKFDDYPNEYPVLPNSTFTLNYPDGTASDSIVVRVIAKKREGNVELIWFKEGLDFTKSSCAGILYKSSILLGPSADALATPPSPSQQPVPIGVTSPSNNSNVP